MDSIDYKHITEVYNEKRKLLPFPTVAASESGVKSILDMYPEIKSMEEADQVKAIGKVIYFISYG